MGGNLSALISIRKLAAEMERDLGLSDMSEPQRLTYLAALDLKDADGQLSSAELRMHPLVKDLARPTFFRAVSALEEAKKLFRPKGVQRGTFSIQPKDADA